MTCSEAWQSLGIGKTRFYVEVAEGNLRTIKSGRRRLVPLIELDRFVKNKLDGESS